MSELHNLYQYMCTGCGHKWVERRHEIARNVPRYSPCPSCKGSENIEILEEVIDEDNTD